MNKLPVISLGLLCSLASLLTSTPPATASPVFNALGVLPDGPLYSRAQDISADGTTVVGESGTPNHGYGSPARMAFRWTEAGGMQYIGPGRAWAVSGNGSIVVGANDYSPWGTIAFRWSGGSASYVVPPSNPINYDDPYFKFATGISNDGSVVVGTGNNHWGNWIVSHPVVWAGGLTVNMDPAAVGYGGIGGGVIAGGYNNASGYGYGPAIFHGGSAQPLGNLGPSPTYGYLYGMAYDVSANGRVAVGYSTSPRASDDWGEAFRWSSREGMVGLGDLPGGDYGSRAWATSANGGVVVGSSQTRYTPDYRHTDDAFYWTPTGGMQKLSTLLTQGFGLNLDGWQYLNDATGVSDSGLVIAGWGTRTNGCEEAFRVKLQQQIYVNWDEPIGTSFKVMKQPRSLNEYVVTAPGSWPGMDWTPELPNGMTPDEYKNLVMLELREIFVASGDMHEIDLLDSRYDAKRTAALEVRFGPSVTGASGNSLLDGKAWDICPKGMPGCDRFNSRWDGQVAVFLQAGAKIPTPAYTADTIAHEVGHGLGLRHVRPGALAPGEVMDYDFVEGMRESFSDLVQQIVEPPRADGEPQADTHNPYYHLKRYVLGQDPGTSQPGTWDVGSVTIQKYDITSINHSGKLHNVTPGMGVGSADGEVGCETWSNVAFFDEVDPGADTLSFYSFADSPLSIFASSEAGDTWDIVFGTGDAENPILTLENLASGAFSGTLFQYNPALDKYNVVGSFSGTVAEEMTLDAPWAVPEPAAGMLLASAMGFLGVVAAARGSRRRGRSAR